MMQREFFTVFPNQVWLGVIGGLLFAIVYAIVTRHRALDLVSRWAAIHGFKIVSAKQRTFVPFMTPAKGQFFRVRLTDSSGSIRQCWLRFHDWTTEPEGIQVDWDE